MLIKLAIEWKESRNQGHFHVSNGSITEMKVAKGEGSVSLTELAFAVTAPCRIELVVETSDAATADPAIVMVNSDVNAFSFFVRDVNPKYPIYIPAYGVAVTGIEDTRSFSQIEQDIRRLGQRTALQQIDDELEESYEEAARNSRDNPGQTWLGLSRDMRIFGVGFRGIGGDERL